MKQDIAQEIEIPADVSIDFDEGIFKVKGENGELERKFNEAKISIEKKDNKIIISSKNATKRERKMTGTITAHIKNMISGVLKEFEYKLQICSVHFPMNVQFDSSRSLVSVKNFLGEVCERKAKVLPGVDVKITGNIITVSSANKEAAGQTALNIENITKVRSKDRRIFQDGIFITEKSGKKI